MGGGGLASRIAKGIGGGNAYGNGATNHFPPTQPPAHGNFMDVSDDSGSDEDEVSERSGAERCGGGG